MKKLRLLFLPILFLAQVVCAQTGKNLVPTATKSLVIFQLKDFGKGPLSKATLVVQSIDKAVLQSGKTDKNGIWECLLPINQTYWISVGDSLNYNQLTVPNKPSTITKHTIFYNGWLNGKPTVVGAPQFNMMPPAEGLASISMEFIGLDHQPLVHEVITLTADGSKKTYVDSTDANGRLVMKVPIGENYTMSVTFLAEFDHFQFPGHGGSYNVRVRYGYAGKQAILDARAKRLADEAAHDAYVKRNNAEQLKYRDPKGHKLEFQTMEVGEVPHPFAKVSTEYGFALKPYNLGPMMSPCFVDGMIVAGASWGSSHLAAVNASTGEPIWSINLKEGGISNIESEEEVVVCATESCTIYAIAAKTGKLLWSKWLASYVLSAPCIANGRVYMSYQDYNGQTLVPQFAAGKPFSMACLDLRTGEILWQQWIRGEVISAAVAEGNRLYFNTFSGHSYVLDAANGNVIAEKPLFATCAPIVVGGQVCMSQRDSSNGVAHERIALFDAQTLKMVKATPYQVAPYIDAGAMRRSKFASNANNLSLNTGYIASPLSTTEKIGAVQLVGTTSIMAKQSFEGSRPLEFNGKIYVAQGHVLRCLDAKTLLQVWEWQYPTSLTDDGGSQMAPPMTVDGKIYVACMDGNIREFDPPSGRITNTYATGETHRQQPIAAQGNFYAPCTDGKLAVIKTGNAGVDGWHCWGGNAARNNQTANR
jgi:outer membrane protein assembly factor BamB